MNLISIPALFTHPCKKKKTHTKNPKQRKKTKVKKNWTDSSRSALTGSNNNKNRDNYL